jgi:uncharacterized membrane protein (UPF0127 family)
MSTCRIGNQGTDTMKHLFPLLFGALLGTIAAMPAAAELATIPLAIGTHKLTAEVAVTPVEVATGLMNRFSLKPDHGMLFIFEHPQPLAFYMRNTYVPLSIAFIGADGRILNIEDMQPQTEDTHWSKGPALYALEMKKGWFAERGIIAGATVKDLPSGAPKR